MSFYSGPRKDRPETQHSEFTKNLTVILAVCTATAIVFLGTGVAELVSPKGKMEGARLYATLGIGFSALLVALVSCRALRAEQHAHKESAVYVELRDKQIRNTSVRGEIYFLLHDIVSSVYTTPEEASGAMKRLARGAGHRVIDGRPFLSLDSVAKFLSTRDDRSSILLMREMKRLISDRDKSRAAE